VPRVAWATDIHLDFVSPAAVEALAAQLTEGNPAAVVLTGDLSDAKHLQSHLIELATAIARPTYFVLGNHDFYHGDVEAVRARARRVSAESRWMRWLPAVGVVDLGGGWGLVGHDGWGDGRHGDPEGSRVMLNDWRLIEEFQGHGAAERLVLLRRRGDEAAAYLAPVLDDALARFAHVLVATHVPPFRAACWHEGGISGDDWLPWFTCKAVGDVLHAAASARPEREIVVICGHTHSGGEVQILPNLRVVTGGAQYGAPAAQPALLL
jgi:Icc protein